MYDPTDDDDDEDAPSSGGVFYGTPLGKPQQEMLNGVLTRARTRQAEDRTQFGQLTERKEASVARQKDIIARTIATLTGQQDDSGPIAALAFASGLLKPTKTGGFAESLGNAGEASIGPLSKMQDTRRSMALKLSELEQAGEGLEGSSAAEQQKLLNSRLNAGVKQETDLVKAGLKGGPREPNEVAMLRAAGIDPDSPEGKQRIKAILDRKAQGKSKEATYSPQGKQAIDEGHAPGSDSFKARVKELWDLSKPKMEGLSPQGKQAAEEGYEPGSPEFKTRVRELWDATKIKPEKLGPNGQQALDEGHELDSPEFKARVRELADLKAKKDKLGPNGQQAVEEGHAPGSDSFKARVRELGNAQRNLSGDAPTSPEDKQRLAFELGVPLPPRDPYAGLSVKSQERLKAQHDKEFQREVAKVAAEADTSAQTNDKIDQFLELNKKHLTAPLVGWAATLIGRADYQTMDSISQDMARHQRQKGEGAISDFDAKVFQKIVPGVGKKLQANTDIGNLFKAANQLSIDRENFFHDYFTAHGHLTGAQRYWRQYKEANPILDKSRASAENVVFNQDRKSYQDWFRERGDGAAKTSVNITRDASGALVPQ